MNATCERLVGTLRRELLDRMLILGEAHLRAVLTEHQKPRHRRPHQGIGQRVPDAEHQPPCITAGHFHARQIRRKPVLSGLINEYIRAACTQRKPSSRDSILFSGGTGLRMLSASVRWRVFTSDAIVTQLVTRPPAISFLSAVDRECCWLSASLLGVYPVHGPMRRARS